MTGPAAATPIARVLGCVDRGHMGPLVLAIGGIHGNEPAGVQAAQRVIEVLEQDAIPLRGKFVALAGNLAALAQRRRYIDMDLNRLWAAPGPATAADHAEQRALAMTFEELVTGWRGPVIAIDLHTSSADGTPFTCAADTLPNRKLALALPVPLVLGLEEAVAGTLLEWFSMRGHVALAIEGGRHDRPATAENLEAALWLLLVSSAALGADQAPDPAMHRGRLAAAAAGMPPAVEIRHRRTISTACRFRMLRELRSFDPVHPRQAIAEDLRGPIHPPFRGRVLLPLYQADGEDGFFLARDVPAWSLVFTHWARRLGLDRLLRLVPGIRSERGDARVLSVAGATARWLPQALFRLFGFRRRTACGRRWRYLRRLPNPEAIELLRHSRSRA